MVVIKKKKKNCPTQSTSWVGLDSYDRLGWVGLDFFLTHHGGLG